MNTFIHLKRRERQLDSKRLKTSYLYIIFSNFYFMEYPSLDCKQTIYNVFQFLKRYNKIIYFCFYLPEKKTLARQGTFFVHSKVNKTWWGWWWRWFSFTNPSLRSILSVEFPESLYTSFVYSKVNQQWWQVSFTIPSLRSILSIELRSYEEY